MALTLPPAIRVGYGSSYCLSIPLYARHIRAKSWQHSLQTRSRTCSTRSASCKTVLQPKLNLGVSASPCRRPNLQCHRKSICLKAGNKNVSQFRAISTIGSTTTRIALLKSPLSKQLRRISDARTGASEQSKHGQSSVTEKQTEATSTIIPQINPLASISKGVKERKENIYTLPNFLTGSRLIAAPAIGWAILTSHPHLALGLFAYAGVTDLIDGFLARRYNSQTVLGTILDPMADKTLMTTVVICLTIQGLLPIWLSTIVLGRDVALAISAIYFRWISLPPPKTFTRYWDFSLPSAEVHPTEISKINTFLQLLLVGNAMLLPALPETLIHAWNLYGVFEGWQLLVASTTVWSGLSYVFNKDAVKILSEEEIKAKARELEIKLDLEHEQQQQQQQQQKRK